MKKGAGNKVEVWISIFAWRLCFSLQVYQMPTTSKTFKEISFDGLKLQLVQIFEHDLKNESLYEFIFDRNLYFCSPCTFKEGKNINKYILER